VSGQAPTRHDPPLRAAGRGNERGIGGRRSPSIVTPSDDKLPGGFRQGSVASRTAHDRPRGKGRRELRPSIQPGSVLGWRALGPAPRLGSRRMSACSRRRSSRQASLNKQECGDQATSANRRGDREPCRSWQRLRLCPRTDTGTSTGHYHDHGKGWQSGHQYVTRAAPSDPVLTRSPHRGQRRPPRR